MRAALRALAEALPRTAAAIRYERRTGPHGVEILRAIAVGGAPGSGVVSVVRADGHTVGLRGELSFADFVRERGWRETPPPAADLGTIADAACFDGMGALRGVTVTPGTTVRISGRLFEPPGPGREVVIEVGESGPERISRGGR